MTELLTKDEYRQIARTLVLPSKAVMDGQLVAAKSGLTFATINPATGKSWGTCLHVPRTTSMPLLQAREHRLPTDAGKRAMRAARALRAGTVTVNSFGEGDITTPFGGYKQSGFGGRDNSVHAHDQYTQPKTIWLDLSDAQTAEL
jgi:acyl-CoA reductase-like NAD-dependent aldehyde dehydrogenase